MKKEDALNQFLENEARTASSKFVFESMSYLDKEHKKATAGQFGESLRRIIREAPELYFLQITLIRSKVFMGKPFYRLEAYGADLYLSEPLFQMELELDWLYDTYAKFAAELDEESRKYMFQIGKPELNRIKLAELYNCQRIVKHLFFETTVYLLSSEEYQALDADRNIQFHLSEYRDAYEILLTKDKNMQLMGGWLCELLQADGSL